MAATKIYVRVGKSVRGSTRGRTYVSASTKASHEPLQNSQGFVPTVAFAVEVEVPDHLFRNAEKVIANLKVTSSKADICAEVAAP